MRKRVYNCGIDILKIMACFGVVFLHFGGGGRVASLSVPIFMFVAAYLCGRLLTEGDQQGLFRRVRRLYVPFFVWGLIYYVVYSIFEHRLDCIVLLQQMTIGAPACPVLYFLFLLVCYTMILYCVGHMQCARWALLVVLFILCFALQYTGLNARLFAPLPFTLKMVLGRFVELFPSAICGYAFYLFSSRHERSVGVVIIGAVLLMGYLVTVFWRQSFGVSGFSYQGAPLLFGAVGVCMVAISGYGVECAWTKMIAELTPGVYYLHLLVGKGIEMIVGRQRGWTEAMIVFFISCVCVCMLKQVRYVKELVK